MKKMRSRRANIGIEVCFNSFYETLERNLKYALTEEKIYADIFINNIDKAGETLRDELFGMHIVDAFSWKEYVILREKVYRIVKEYTKAIKNIER